MKTFHILPLILAAAGALCSCQSQKAYPVFFLAQEPTDNAAASTSGKFIVVYRGRTYTRMPIMTLNHFSKFKSFLNNDGTYGVELFVKPEYRNHLYTATLNNSGRLLLPVVNGLAFEPQRIDPITDGELVIWNGLNGYDLKQIARTVKPIDEALEKKRFRDKNPRPLPKKPKNPRQTKDFTGRTVGELFN